MAIDERRRLALYDAAKQQLGEGPAGTLMELLPLDVTDLATKQDLAVLSADLRSAMAELRVELQTELREQTNRLLMFVIPTMLSGIGLAFVAARF